MTTTSEIAESLPSWKLVWRKGVAPLLSTGNLEALRKALVNDDPRLLQGATTTPPPLHCVQDWPVEAACLLSYPFAVDLGGFQANADGTPNEGAATVAVVEEAFARACFDADQRVGEPAAIRWLLNYWDDTPREDARASLLLEVGRSLQRRLEGLPDDGQEGGAA